MTEKNVSIEARMSAAEANINGIADDVKSLVGAVSSLRDAISGQQSSFFASQRPQWGNLLAAITVGCIVISAIGASYLAPVTIQIAAHAKLLDERGAMFERVQDRIRDNEQQIATNRQAILTNKEVTQQQIATLREDLDKVSLQGSSLTRERLAVLEDRMEHGRAAP